MLAMFLTVLGWMLDVHELQTLQYKDVGLTVLNNELFLELNRYETTVLMVICCIALMNWLTISSSHENFEKNYKCLSYLLFISFNNKWIYLTISILRQVQHNRHIKFKKKILECIVNLNKNNARVRIPSIAKAFSTAVSF